MPATTPTTPARPPKAAAKTAAADAPPLRWGTSSAAFCARLKNEVVTVHFQDAADPPMCGRLVGVDQYDIFLEVGGTARLICKHAIRSVTPGDVCPCPLAGIEPLGAAETTACTA